MASSVDVSVEILQECLIQEVTLDGQEIYVQPLSMSENLTKLAHKIDFSKDENDEKCKPASELEKKNEDEEKILAAVQPSLWPWDSVRNKLKTALIEMNVLHDVLSISRDRRFMTLDYVPQEVSETRSGLLFVARKRALGMAGNILSNGLERMKKSMDVSLNARHSNNQEFHYELQKLRTNWRLKKVGGAILGDLSYKSAGSRFWQSGSFEVSKSDLSSSDVPIDSLTSTPPGQASPLRNSSLQVTVPNELEGVAYIHVVIKDLSETNPGVWPSEVGIINKRLTAPVPSIVHWSNKLEAAQNVIFCKEVFAQLAREAVQIRSQIPHVVVGNQIISNLFPGIHLSISLRHDTENNKPLVPDVLSKMDHNAVVEHSLHQLLREAHFRNFTLPMPHPVTATLGLTKRRRLSGPHGYTKSQFMEFNNSESMLEQVVQQARYIVIRQRTLRTLDELAASLQDPQIIVHISNLGSAVETSVRVSISFSGYDSIKTNFALCIGSDCVKAICKDGQHINLSGERDVLKDFVLRQVSEHHILSVQSSAKMLGWKVTSSNNRVGVGNLEPVGNALGLMIVSPFQDRVLSIRCGPTSGAHIFVQKRPLNVEVPGMTVMSCGKWSRINEQFQEIHLSKIDGRNFAQKIEIVMACLMPERPFLSNHRTESKLLD